MIESNAAIYHHITGSDLLTNEKQTHMQTDLRWVTFDELQAILHSRPLIT